MKTLGGRCINEYASVTTLNLGGFRAGSYGGPRRKRVRDTLHTVHTCIEVGGRIDRGRGVLNSVSYCFQCFLIFQLHLRLFYPFSLVLTL